MKQSIKLLLGGAFLLSLPMFLTSCEDILGEWDKPAPVNVIVTPDDGGTEDHSNQYIKYTSATDSSYVNIEGATEWTGTVTPGDVAAGTYVVSGTATCAGQLVLKGEVNIILKDGAKLTVDDGITYDMTNNVGSLNIFGQGISSNMGQLIVNNNTPVDFGGGTEASAIVAKGLSIHGGKIDATADTGTTPAAAGGDGLEVPMGDGNIIIYNGKVTATAKNNFRVGIALWGTGKIEIANGEVYAYGAGPGGQGIAANNAGTGTLNIIGGKVTAKDTSVLGEGINCDIINITGGTVIAENGAGGNPALNAGTSLTISGTETIVTAKGGNIDGTYNASYGIGSPSITIDGGTISAIGGDGDGTVDGQDAISCTDGMSGTFSANGGQITASGGADGGSGNAGKAIAGAGLTINIAAGLTFFEGDAENPSTGGTAGPATPTCNKRYVIIK